MQPHCKQDMTFSHSSNRQLNSLFLLLFSSPPVFPGVPPQVVASGLRSSPDRSPQAFNGCIHNVQINGEPQDLSYRATGAGRQVLWGRRVGGQLHWSFENLWIKRRLMESQRKVKICRSAERHSDFVTLHYNLEHLFIHTQYLLCISSYD